MNDKADAKRLDRLLTIKIGNTNLGFGVHERDQLVHAWRAETRVDKTADEYAAFLLACFESVNLAPASIQHAALVSVVPPLTETLREFCRKYLRVEPFIVAAGIQSGIQIRYDDPRALGADRLVVLVAAKARYGAPCVVIDFGTATTFNALDARGDFIGGAIAPGLNMSADALHQFTAKLPRIEIVAPARALGVNTRDALRSGIFFGYLGLTQGIVERIKTEMRAPAARVIATGGMAQTLAPHCAAIEIVDLNLALDGLRILYEMNSGQRKGIL
ncbi:MAG: Type III pantothenate kinase [Anaerolineae bacterium]|nr:Type III pantothenate kinase [Anaerolineae bacterium]